MGHHTLKILFAPFRMFAKIRNPGRPFGLLHVSMQSRLYLHPSRGLGTSGRLALRLSPSR